MVRLALAALLAATVPSVATGAECGEWPNKPCSADKRYNPNVSFKLKKNSPVWRDLQGYWSATYKYEGIDGRPLTPQYVTKAFRGMQLPFDRHTVKAFYNITLRGTKFYQHAYFVYPPASSDFCETNPPDDIDGSKAGVVLSTLFDTCGEEGYSTFGELYGVASDEKDGIMEVKYSRGMFGNLQDGEPDLTGVVGEMGRGVPVDASTMYFTRKEGSRMDSETLVFTNEWNTRASGTGSSFVFDDSALFNAHPLSASYTFDMVQTGQEDWEAQILEAYTQAKVPDRYQVPVPMIGGCVNKAKSGAVRCPEEVLETVASTFERNDPKVKPNEYVEEPSTQPGVIAGFVVLAVAILVIGLVLLHMHLQKKQAQRYKHMFARRVAQTIRIEGGHKLLTPKALAEEFRRIDEDKSGFLDREELRAFVQSGKVGIMSDSDFNALFAAMDVDGSGQIDFAEFCSFLSVCGDVYDEEEMMLTKSERTAKLTSAANRLSMSLLGSSTGKRSEEGMKNEDKDGEGMA